MSGSSKSLIRALEAVFDQWNESPISIKEHSNMPEANELFRIIAIFHDKHNTMQTVRPSNNMNEELYRIYSKQVASDTDVSKELFFLEILKQILPIMIEDEVLFWLKIYLKPAVDSAGFDLQFVNKSREFILSMATKPMNSPDPYLVERREGIAFMVMNEILRIYIGPKPRGNDQCYNLIRLHYNSNERESQSMCERIRFIEKNCAFLLRDYGLKYCKKFFELIDTYLAKETSRLKVLILLSQFTSYQTSRVQEIINTSLFGNLLNSILYDLSESIVLVSLSVLVMIIPQVCDKLSGYLPDLLVIYVRIITWKHLDSRLPDRLSGLKKFLKESSTNWEIANFDPSYHDEEVSFQTKSKIEFDSSYLATLIYGLFPLNFRKFHEAPLNYLVENPPKIVDPSFLIKINNSFSNEGDPYETNLESIIKSMTRNFLKRFLLHPNFLNPNHTLRSELKNPISWLLEEITEENIVCEEIALGCLNLNPDLFFIISDDVVDGKSTTSSTSDAKSIKNLDNDSFGFVYSGTGNKLLNKLNSVSSGSGKTSLKGSNYSSFSGPSFKDHITSQKLANLSLNRKLSIVSTNLIIDEAQDQKKNEGLGIQFKDVNFDKGLAQDPSEIIEESEDEKEVGAPDDANRDVLNYKNYNNSNVSIKDLFDNHERLYTPHPSYQDVHNEHDPEVNNNNSILHPLKNASSFLNDHLQLQKPVSSPTTSVETTTIHKDSLLSSGTSFILEDTIGMQSPTMNSGSSTSIDYYQRELLLMKNELEFLSYMKHLNKFHYIRLKLRMNRMLRESSMFENSIENRNNFVKLQNLTTSYNSLSESFKILQNDKDEINLKMRQDKLKLTDEMISLKEENESLRENLGILMKENEKLENDLHSILHEKLLVKEDEIKKLLQKLKDYETQLQKIETNTKVINDENKVDENKGSFFVNELEQENIELRTSLKALTLDNSRLNQDIKQLEEMHDISMKSYESKLNAVKNDLNDNVSQHTMNYEKKLQEMSRVLLKYESLLEDRNSQIIQLTTSKPINITASRTSSKDGIEPARLNNRTFNRPSTNEYGFDFDMQARSNSSEDTVSSPSITNGVPQNLLQQQKPSVALQSSTQAPPPIIRGRGGYQKRSKKHM